MASTPVPDPRWLRIKALFAGALEQPPEARDAWLDAQCRDDPELRSQLDSLIRSHESGDGFMETPALAAPGAAEAVAERVAPSIQAALAGRRAGPYRLVRELGRGGMGVVYLAERDDEAFRRHVAIKMVHGGVLHPSLLDRFHAERRILALLEHPNIAQLLDAGTDETGAPFAVMEYVEGTPIDEFVQVHRLPVRRRLELFLAVCDAVEYSHQRLVVHRDIKPGNVLVTAGGVPKLLDFGIAKLLDPSGAGADRTRTGLRALTPESASPEQVRGEPATVATDVYSLGVLLFRLLTDRSPYRGPLRTDLDLARAICEEEPPRPSEAFANGRAGLSPPDIAAARRALRGDLDLITLKALKKDPRERYVSVERLARDVRRHVAGEPVEAVPDSRRYRAGKFLRRHRTAALVAGALALSLAGGLAATLRQARAAHIQRDRAERRFNDVRGLATSMIFEVHDAIEPLPGSTSARELLMRRAIEYLDRIASESGDDPALQRELASAYIRIGNVQGYAGGRNLGQLPAAIESFRKGLAIRERLARAAPSDRVAQGELARVRRNFGGLLATIGDGEAALEHFRASASLGERLVAGDPSDLAARAELGWSYLTLSDGVSWHKDWQRALSLLRQALALFRQAAEATPQDVRLQRAMASTHRRIGRLEKLQGSHERALEAYRSALEIDGRLLAAQPDSPDARMDWSLDIGEVASCLLALGDPRGALAQCDRGRAICEDLVRADPHDTRARFLLAAAMDRLGGIRWHLGERAPALDARQSALRHLDALAAIQPDDVRVQGLRATELAELGLGYAQLDAARSRRDRCGRAREYLARAREAYRTLDAKDQLGDDVTPSLAQLETTLSGCGVGR
jgi:non-specific serine/threonine protein kinase/serine/threonine-protein kinase